MIELDRTLQLLLGNNVALVIVGGVAESLYGSSSGGMKLEVLCDISQTNLTHLGRLLADIHARPRGEPAGQAIELKTLVQSDKICRLTTDLGDLDIMGEVAGIGGYEHVRVRASIVSLSGRDCPVLSLDGLIAARRAAGRAIDLQVLPELEAIREAQEPEKT